MFSLRVDGEVSLELAEERDAQALFDLTDRNREHLRPWMPWVDGTLTVADSLAFLRFARGEYAAGRGLHCGLRFDGVMVGTIGTRIDVPHDACEIGYWIDRDMTGRGIVTRAARALTTAAFDELGMHRVSIRAGVENVRSRAVPERLGFTFEGVLRDAERVGDRYLSLATYSVLADEWRAGTLRPNDAGAT
ncbi:MAG: ribosomal-protein-serine acetyltransferase [Frankiaceae bacterium]|jgi:ribosomal-protein-serine acetyltransferase|nr:ribosomal-protein-serine acetyltransferase [Frankiaceae bacterium]